VAGGAQRARRPGVEEGDAALAADAIDLGAKRPVAWPPGMRDVLQEGAFPDEPFELGLGDEVVLAPVALARPPLAGRRRHGELELGQTAEELPLERSLAGPRGAGDDDDRPCARSGPSG